MTTTYLVPLRRKAGRPEADPARSVTVVLDGVAVDGGLAELDAVRDAVGYLVGAGWKVGEVRRVKTTVPHVPAP